MIEIGGDVAPLHVIAPHGAVRASLLWLPAMGVPARKYLPFAEALAARGIRSALLEWRGTERSPVRASRALDWGYATLLDDVALSRAALDRAYREPGIATSDSASDAAYADDAEHRRAPSSSWLIGGHSLGAQLAGLAAAAAPDRYAGYVVVGSGQPWWRAWPMWQRPIIFAVFAWFRALAGLCGYFPGDRVGFAGREAAHVVREWARSGFTGCYRVDGVALDFEAALRAYAGPTLALRGTHDRYVPKGSLDHLVAKLPRSEVTRIELEPRAFPGGRADHFAWMRDSAPVVAAIAAWVDRLPGRTSQSVPLQSRHEERIA